MAAVTQTHSLTEAILDSGIQATNYFNGRILNAGDLQTDQEANQARREQLGRAVGHGIVNGLWVELAEAGSGTTPPIVAVKQGLAFNANGQAIALPLDVKVALTRTTAPLPVDAGLFTDCAPPTATTVPLQAGVYILAASPASGYSGSAPMFGFGDTSAATGCGSRYAVEGVRFRLVELDVSQLPGISQATRDAIAALMLLTDAPSGNKLRNWLAHLCFGTEQLSAFLVSPFPPTQGGASAFVGYTALDALVSTGALTPGDVPVALIYWTLQGVQFIDRWSVRRRQAPPASSTYWPLPYNPRRRVEGEAVFLQYEEQMSALTASGLTQGALSMLRAVDCFRYLPASGIVPLAGFGASRGVDPIQFFAGHTTRPPVFIEGALLATLLQSSLAYPPVDDANQEMMWLYTIRENMQAVADQVPPPTAYMIFANGHIPYLGNAHFDLSHWNYANFASVP